MKAADARVLLTGASGGIGRALCATLRAHGAKVLGTGRTDAPAGLCDAWVRADITTEAGIAAVTEAAMRWRATVVVHAAGLPCFAPLAQTTDADIDSVLATNLIAPMRLTRAMLPHLLAQSEAQVVFTGSALARIGLPGFALYGASKAGLHGFAESLRRELADTSVRVKTLAPRSTRTAFNDPSVEAFNRATGTASDPPERVAQALIALLEGRRAECFIGFPEKLAVRLNGLLGGLMDGAFSRHRRALRQASPSSARPAEVVRAALR